MLLLALPLVLEKLQVPTGSVPPLTTRHSGRCLIKMVGGNFETVHSDVLPHSIPSDLARNDDCFIIDGDSISAEKLTSSADFDIAIDQDFTRLDSHLCLAAGSDQSSVFEEPIEPKQTGHSGRLFNHLKVVLVRIFE